MLEPTVFVFYVRDLAASCRFYHELLGIRPIQHSPTYLTFQLSNGMIIGLKDRPSPQPFSSGGTELAFTVTHRVQVDELFVDWQGKGIDILEPPTSVSFGYTFVARDLDGHRLRVAALGK